MGAENVFLEPHAKRRRGEPASVADEMLHEEEDDDGLELGVTVVGVAEDDVVDDTSRQVLFTQQMLLTQMERQALYQQYEVEAWRRAEGKDAFLWFRPPRQQSENRVDFVRLFLLFLQGPRFFVGHLHPPKSYANK